MPMRITLRDDLEALCAYVQQLPTGEIFSLLDWLASLDQAYIFALTSRIYSARRSAVTQGADYPETVLAFAFALGAMESGMAWSNKGRLSFLAQDCSGKSPEQAHRLLGVLLAETLRRAGVLEVRRLSMVGGGPLWMQPTEKWRRHARYTDHPGLRMLARHIPTVRWGVPVIAV